MKKTIKMEKMINFGWLINDVLWAIKPRNQKIVNELENLINEKTELGFTKDEFIKEFVLISRLFSVRPIEQYNEVDYFILSFCNDVYDMVMFKSNNFNLSQRIKDFDILNEKYNKINSVD